MSHVGNIVNLAKENTHYRHMVHTTDMMQVGVMMIEKSRETGTEKHDLASQYVQVVKGVALVTVGRGKDKTKFRARMGESFMIPPGTYHNIRGGSKNGLRLITVYSPAIHAAGEVVKECPTPMRGGRARASPASKAGSAKASPAKASPAKKSSAGRTPKPKAPCQTPSRRTAKVASAKATSAKATPKASPRASSKATTMLCTPVRASRGKK